MLILLGLAAAVAFPSGPLPAPERRAIMRYLDASLLDGSSARWKWPASKKGPAYCGWVNAKNLLGAYTGWMPFVVLRGEDGRLTGSVASEGHTVVVETVCGARGYNYTEPPTD